MKSSECRVVPLQQARTHLQSRAFPSWVGSPQMFKVMILNDDYTPMAFVVDVLEKFFEMDALKAEVLMLQVHYTGFAVCGVYTHDIAEMKVAQVNSYAQKNEHPLVSRMDEA